MVLLSRAHVVTVVVRGDSCEETEMVLRAVLAKAIIRGEVENFKLGVCYEP